MADKDTKSPEIDLIEEPEVVQDALEETSKDAIIEDEHEDLEEEDQSNLSSSILRVITILAIGAIGGVWAAPKVAPILPAGLKPVAEFLSPQADTSAQIAALQADFDTRLAKIEATSNSRNAIAQITPVLDQLKNNDTDLNVTVNTLSKTTKALEKGFTALQTELTKLNARQALSTQSGQVSDEALQQFEEELTAITQAQQKLNQSQSQAVEAQQDADSKLRLAEATSALAQISNALKIGKPFETELAQLSAVAGITAPVELADIAANGTPPLSDLKKQLPALARIALRDAAASSSDTTLGLFTSFLKSQIGTRSLEPQSGDGLDAVLSRIEAAINASDTDIVLSETAALSAPAQKTMSGWITSLTQLNDATSAVQTLQQQLITN